MEDIKDYEVDIRQYIDGVWVLIGTLKFTSSTEEIMNSTLWKMGELLETHPVVHFREGLDSFIVTVANGPISLLTFDSWRRAEAQKEVSAKT
jgi:hypothetical protein